MLSVIIKTHAEEKNTTHKGETTWMTSVTSVPFGSTIQVVMERVNQMRTPKTHIGRVYNQYGQEIPRGIWDKVIIKENLELFTDTPN